MIDERKNLFCKKKDLVDIWTLRLSLDESMSPNAEATPWLC
jgi:hypothetical protein